MLKAIWRLVPRAHDLESRHSLDEMAQLFAQADQIMQNPYYFMEIQSVEEQLTARNVPAELAQECARIVAKDDANLPNLGRTRGEQETIARMMQYLQGE